MRSSRFGPRTRNAPSKPVKKQTSILKTTSTHDNQPLFDVSNVSNDKISEFGLKKTVVQTTPAKEANNPLSKAIQSEYTPKRFKSSTNGADVYAHVHQEQSEDKLTSLLAHSLTSTLVNAANNELTALLSTYVSGCMMGGTMQQLCREQLLLPLPGSTAATLVTRVIQQTSSAVKQQVEDAIKAEMTLLLKAQQLNTRVTQSGVSASVSVREGLRDRLVSLIGRDMGVEEAVLHHNAQITTSEQPLQRSEYNLQHQQHTQQPQQPQQQQQQQPPLRQVNTSVSHSYNPSDNTTLPSHPLSHTLPLSSEGHIHTKQSHAPQHPVSSPSSSPHLNAVFLHECHNHCSLKQGVGSQTALSHSISHITRLLGSGASVNAVDQHGVSGLMVGVIKGNMVLVSTLVNYCHDTHTPVHWPLSDVNECNILMLACLYQQKHTLEYVCSHIFTHQPHILKQLLTKQDRSGKTAADMARDGCSHVIDRYTQLLRTLDAESVNTSHSRSYHQDQDHIALLPTLPAPQVNTPVPVRLQR